MLEVSHVWIRMVCGHFGPWSVQKKTEVTKDRSGCNSSGYKNFIRD